MGPASDDFAEVVGAGDDLALDRACALIAAAIDPAVDVEAELERLDRLADHVATHDFDGVIGHLFGVEGFTGDEDDYYDPANSLLPQVLDRRKGIPITLSIVAIEVARRLGVAAHGVGMPGHFLLGDPTRPGLFVDPFSGGVLLDRPACRRVFEQLHGSDARWDDSLLDPVGRLAIVRRVLNNLGQIARARNERRLLATVMDLVCRLPDATPSDRLDLAKALAGVGRFSDAADVVEHEMHNAPDGSLDDLATAAKGLRARLN